MNKTYKDTDLREALHRKYADEPQLPADFMAKMEGRLDAKPIAKRSMLWRWVAAAACLLIIIGISLMMMPDYGGEPAELLLAATTEQPKQEDQKVEPAVEVQKVSEEAPQGTPVSVRTGRTKSLHGTDQEFFAQGTKCGVAIARDGLIVAPRGVEPMDDSNLHYASNDLTKDTIPYQAPSRVDDFIAKLADYHKVKPVVLDCSGEARDTSIVGTAYLFNDTQELDLFGRLLQVACCYDSKTPGYLLNFSHQQFFFCLKDLQKQEKYLWIAERINGQRILLFSTRSPIEAEVSSACFQVYREQLTHTDIKTLQF